MKRFVLLLSALAMLAPMSARAEGTTYTAPYSEGPQGGDSANSIRRDVATGEITTIRHQAFGISGSLGCGGTGAFSYFAVTHTAVEPVTAVTVNWSDGVFSPYSYVNVGVRQGDDYVDSEVVRQPLPGDGTVTVAIPPTTGTLTAWFGLQLSSACPSAEAAHAKFDSITFSG